MASVTVTVDAPHKRPPAQPPAPEVVVLREWQIYILRGPGFDGRALLFVSGLPSADGRANLFVVAERPGGAPLPLKLRMETLSRKKCGLWRYRSLRRKKGIRRRITWYTHSHLLSRAGSYNQYRTE